MSIVQLEGADQEVRTPVVARPGVAQTVITALILGGPLVGVVFAAFFLARHETTVTSLAIAVGLYLVTGHGLTAGYHRMCTHRAFRANRATKLVLVIAGSLGFEGGVLAWVGNHRQHHAYTDVTGDPHSPHLAGASLRAQVRGAAHAHVGWLFAPPAQERERWIPDLMTDKDLLIIDRLFPLWCVISLAIPTLLGWAITGTAAGALGGFIWGGLVRIFVLHQATFAVNSACHLWGKRPFRTRSDDQARNVWVLAVLAMGENWHNLHHSLPASARHGVRRHEWDSTARLIWLLERLRLVRDVRWPDQQLLAARARPGLAIED